MSPPLTTPHGEPLTKPILALPPDVARALVEAGVATPCPNPVGQFAAGDWWLGLLQVYSTTASTVTLVQGREAVRNVVEALRGLTSESRLEFAYRTRKGSVRFELGPEVSRDEAFAAISSAYDAIAEDIEE
jgi:hypothetical protein